MRKQYNTQLALESIPEAKKIDTIEKQQELFKSKIDWLLISKDILDNQSIYRWWINKILKNAPTIKEFKRELKKWNKWIETIIDNPLELVTKEVWMKLKGILEWKWIKLPKLTTETITKVNAKDRNDLQNKIKVMLQPFWLWSWASDDYNYSRVVNV